MRHEAVSKGTGFFTKDSQQNGTCSIPQAQAASL